MQGIVAMGKFVDFFRGPVNMWQANLGQVELVLKVWVNVTRQWSSLEAIFLKSDDIRNQLPEDTKRFEAVDKAFKEMMADEADLHLNHSFKHFIYFVKEFDLIDEELVPLKDLVVLCLKQRDKCSPSKGSSS